VAAFRLFDHIQHRLRVADLAASDAEITRLTAYIEILTKWNRRINLTALALDDPSDAAIDRLIVEPVLGSRHVWPYDQTLLDLGSGGGSPAIPLGIMRPALRLTMVESRMRKAAFLREAVRTLELEGAAVENDRYERLSGRAALAGSMDVVSFRALRAVDELWAVVRHCLAPGGRVFWFGAPNDIQLPDGFVQSHRLPLDSGKDSWLAIAARQRP
jgi:16S rRNA (guanine527-N7)-methyltransferase